MSYSLNLDDSWLKLARAEKYADQLKSQIESAGAPDYRSVPLRREFDHQSSCIIYRVDRVLQVSDEWSLIVGDTLHNFRCALDYLAWQLALRLYNGTIPANAERSIQFPIVSNQDDWPNHRHRLHMSADDAAKLESSQPFQVAGQPHMLTPLGVLAALSNADKHRKINLVVTHVTTGTLQNDGWGCRDCDLHDGPIRVEWSFSGKERAGEEVMRFPVIPTGPNPDVQVNVQIAREVTFEQTWPAIDCLDNIGMVVAKILERF